MRACGHTHKLRRTTFSKARSPIKSNEDGRIEPDDGTFCFTSSSSPSEKSEATARRPQPSQPCFSFSICCQGMRHPPGRVNRAKAFCREPVKARIVDCLPEHVGVELRSGRPGRRPSRIATSGAAGSSSRTGVLLGGRRAHLILAVLGSWRIHCGRCWRCGSLALRRDPVPCALERYFVVQRLQPDYAAEGVFSHTGRDHAVVVATKAVRSGAEDGQWQKHVPVSLASPCKRANGAWAAL